MIRLAAALVLGLSPLSVAAQAMPALFDVTGVASDDVLNIRAEPDAGSAILGTLAPDAQGVEAVALSPDGAWVMVSTGEQRGWAASRYLVLQPGQDGALLSRALTCSGTEPFWSARLAGDATLAFEEMGAPPVTGPMALAPSTNRTDKEGMIARLQGDLLATGVVTREMCSDGMSDRTYGITLDLILSGPGGDALFSGCCSLR